MRIIIYVEEYHDMRPIQSGGDDMIEWTDTTSYSQGQRGKVVPDQWTVESGRISVTVHRYVGCGDVWFVTCHAIKVMDRELQSEKLSDARIEALAIVKDAVADIKRDADALPDE